MSDIPRILVVDDEPDLELLMRQRFRKKLRNNELVFEFALNGVEALKILNENKDIQVVMTDINMPQMDGLTLLEKIKEEGHLVKTVVVSAYGDMDNIRTAMNRGAFDFLTKPVDFSDLTITLEKSVIESRMIREGMEAIQQVDRAIEEKIRAEESESIKQQFLANMSHEIRTPMNAVMGMTHLLLKNEPRPDQLRYLNAIEQSADNLLVIINDILDFSKIEAGKLELETIPFSVTDSIGNVYEVLKFKADDKKLAFELELDPTMPARVVGDPTRLNQVLINLAGNAIKFTEKGGVRICTKVTELSSDSVRIRFDVIDSGIGIPKDKLDSIFDSFTQASSETTRKFGGTGLGLAISKRLVELQGGVMDVESEEGIGSDFWFEIPFKTKQEETAAVVDDSPAATDLTGVRILLVEDNEFNVMVAVDTLESEIENVQIEVAKDGQEGFEKIRDQEFDIVLMDIHMPIMDGLETTRKVRAEIDTEDRKVKIMAMTASATKEEVENCFAAGMDEYISKPFQVEELLHKISSLVN